MNTSPNTVLSVRFGAKTIRPLGRGLYSGATWRRRSESPGNGLGAAVGSSGEFSWQLTPGLWESSDGGRRWEPVSPVSYGMNGDIVTYGAHEAWHLVIGHGIFRTLNGTFWKLLK